MNKNLFYFIITIFFASYSSVAQETYQTADGKNIIQFTGVVFAPDSVTGIPGVHVYVPKGGRGTTTNAYGFFSMPVVEGDSVVISTVGFKKTHYIIPEHDGETSLKILSYMKEDIAYLNEVEVFPYPSEATFKAAILAAELPYQKDLDNLNAYLSSEAIRAGYWNLDASPNMNARYFYQQQALEEQYRYGAAPLSLLNPFAWASFIRSLKNNN